MIRRRIRRASQVAFDLQIGRFGFRVGGADAGEFRDLAGQRPGVEALGIAAPGCLQVAFDVDLEEAPSRQQAAGEAAVGAKGGMATCQVWILPGILQAR